MTILLLLQKQDVEIAKLAAEVDAADIEANRTAQIAAEKRTRLEALRKEKTILEDVARRHGELADAPATPAVTITPVSETVAWQIMSRLDAVERVLRESETPLHLRQIVDVLAQHGRDDAYDVVSASLAHLRQRRGSVQPTSRGVWRYQEPLIGQSMSTSDRVARAFGGAPD